MRKSTKIILIVCALLVVGSVFYVAKMIFLPADETVGVEKLVGGDFETATTFDVGTGANQWSVITNSGQPAPALITTGFGQALNLEITNPIENGYNQVGFHFPLTSGKLYHLEITFGNEFSSAEPTVSTGLADTTSSEVGTTFFTRFLNTVADNEETKFSVDFSPLQDKPNSMFYIKIATGDDLKAGKVKIKKASVLEKGDSQLSVFFPRKEITYPGGTNLALYFAVPWHLGEANFPVKFADSAALAETSQPAVVYQHDTDDLDFNYQPRVDEVLSHLYLDAAQGEDKQFYFTVYAKEALTDLTVSIDDFFLTAPPDTPPPIIPPGGTGSGDDIGLHPVIKNPSGNLLPQVGDNPPNIYSLRYREKQPIDKNYGIFSYKNELIEPFYKRQILPAGQNQSFMIEVPISQTQTANTYTANLKITAGSFSQTIPIDLTVRPFTLDKLTASRTLFLMNDRYLPLWKADTENAKKQIAAEVDTAFQTGFNSFEFGRNSMGVFKKEDGNNPDKITGYSLADYVAYTLTYAATASPYKSQFTGNNLFEMDNLLERVLIANDFVPLTGANKYASIRKMIIGAVAGDSAEIAAVAELTAAQKTDIRNQITAVLTNLNTQYLSITGNNNWLYYLTDEPSSDRILYAKWLAETAKAQGIKTYSTCTSKKSCENIADALNNGQTPLIDALAVFQNAGGKSTSLMLRNKSISPWSYQGVYAWFDGNEIRGRYLAGFLAYKSGLENTLAWYYMGIDKPNTIKNDVNQMNDFNRTSTAGYDNGRWWNLEYYDNPAYRTSYQNFYGYPIDSVKNESYKNINTLQFVAYKQADTDLRYLKTLERLLNEHSQNNQIAPIVSGIRTDLNELLDSLPTDHKKIIFGYSRFNGQSTSIMNKILLDTYRKQIAEWIVQLQAL